MVALAPWSCVELVVKAQLVAGMPRRGVGTDFPNRRAEDGAVVMARACCWNGPPMPLS